MKQGLVYVNDLCALTKAVEVKSSSLLFSHILQLEGMVITVLVTKLPVRIIRIGYVMFTRIRPPCGCGRHSTVLQTSIYVLRMV